MKKSKKFPGTTFLVKLFAPSLSPAVLYPFGSSPASFSSLGSTAPDGAVSQLVLRSALGSLSAFRSPRPGRYASYYIVTSLPNVRWLADHLAWSAICVTNRPNM